MADLERTYNIPLRKEFRKVPRYKRAKKAITALRQFLVKHMKSEDILLGNEINHEVWAKGIKNPPHHIKVTAVKDGEGIVRAELEGHDFKVVSQKAKKEDDTSLMGRMKKKMGVDGAEEEEKKEAPKEAPKKEVKAEPAPKAEPKKEAVKEAPKKEEPKKEAPKPAEKSKTKVKSKAEKQAKLAEKAE